VNPVAVNPSATDDDFLAAAQLALTAEPGAVALDALTWWDLLAELEDDDPATAVFATFRAQGRTLADTPALGGLLAQPVAAVLGLAPGSVVAAIARRSPARGPVWVLTGDTTGRDLLFDVPGRGAYLVPAGEVERTVVDLAGHLSLVEVVADLDVRRPDVPEPVAATLRRRATRLGRTAAAAEMLGAAEQVVALAVEYVGVREQFGRPIGTFQALRHLLAWASTDCVAIEAVVRRAIALRADPPPELDLVVKALAGRNGRRACDRALQAFGGIGFTAEHDHHHFHSRVLLLDALLGSSAELSHDLGAWLRTSGDDPAYPAAVLATVAV
jgi:Acyl-CoA dehydrogenase, C-terminal domain